MRYLCLCLLLLLPAFAFRAPAGKQDETPDDLVKKLSHESFEVQGRAAESLARMGSKALPALEKAAKSEDAQARAWAEKILARIRGDGARLKTIIERLASADDEEKEAAEAELRGLGARAATALEEAAKSENKNLRRRAEKFLAELRGESAGGRFQSRLGRKRALVARGGGGAETEDAVLAALKWLARHQEPDGSWAVTAYTARCKGDKCAPNPGRDTFDAGVTGLALLAFLGAGYTPLSKDTHGGIFIDRNRSDPVLSGGKDLLVRDLPDWDGFDIDFYHWYAASLAFFQYDGPDGKHWAEWNKRMKEALVRNQNAKGCAAGSWEPVDRWSCEGGRVYATAINALTFETYYRYVLIFGGK